MHSILLFIKSLASKLKKVLPVDGFGIRQEVQLLKELRKVYKDRNREYILYTEFSQNNSGTYNVHLTTNWNRCTKEAHEKDFSLLLWSYDTFDQFLKEFQSEFNKSSILIGPNTLDFAAVAFNLNTYKAMRNYRMFGKYLTRVSADSTSELRTLDEYNTPLEDRIVSFSSFLKPLPTTGIKNTVFRFLGDIFYRFHIEDNDLKCSLYKFWKSPSATNLYIYVVDDGEATNPVDMSTTSVGKLFISYYLPSSHRNCLHLSTYDSNSYSNFSIFLDDIVSDLISKSIQVKQSTIDLINMTFEPDVAVDLSSELEVCWTYLDECGKGMTLGLSPKNLNNPQLSIHELEVRLNV